MYKTRKALLSLAICFVLVVSSAAGAFAAEPRINGFQCGRCGTGTVYVTTTTQYVISQEPCQHGYQLGWDYWYGYMTYENEDCDFCNYNKTYAWFTKTAFISCEGSNPEILNIEHIE